jgi:exonuclease III
MEGATLDEAISVAVWNLQWRKSSSRAATVIRDRLSHHAPDIICLTECYADFLPGSHVIEGQPDWGYAPVQGRRKVMLWSKEPWDQVDPLGSDNLPAGRFIAGRTNTAAGPVDVIGVCVPWGGAHVSTGQRNRKQWEDHLAYLAALQNILADKQSRTRLMGDFNQCVPRRTAPVAAYAALEQAVIENMAIATSGTISPLDRAAIDHVAHTADFEPASVAGISNVGPTGAQLSDHFGVHVRLNRRSRA